MGGAKHEEEKQAMKDKKEEEGGMDSVGERGSCEKFLLELVEFFFQSVLVAYQPFPCPFQQWGIFERMWNFFIDVQFLSCLIAVTICCTNN